MISTSFAIHQFKVGPMQNFVYLVGDHGSRRAAVVDPAWDSAELLECAGRRDFTITDVLLTHSHHDHVNGLPDILGRYDPNIHLTRKELEFWKNPPRGRAPSRPAAARKARSGQHRV